MEGQPSATFGDTVRSDYYGANGEPPAEAPPGAEYYYYDAQGNIVYTDAAGAAAYMQQQEQQQQETNGMQYDAERNVWYPQEFYPEAGQQPAAEVPPVEQKYPQQHATTTVQVVPPSDVPMQPIAEPERPATAPKPTGLSGDWYEPPTGGILADTSTEFFLSTGFRLYLCYNLFVIFMLMATLGFNYTWGVLYRFLIPPKQDKNSFLQSFAFFSLFFPLCFFIIGLLGVIMDMISEVWKQTRNDTKLWGMGWYDKKAPWSLYALIIILEVFLPFVWVIIKAFVHGETILHCFQFFTFLTALFTLFIVILCFFWFYLRAISQKSKSLGRRLEPTGEETTLVETVVSEDNTRTTKKNYKSWYHSEVVLEEYGLDVRSVNWMLVVVTFCVFILMLMQILICISTVSNQVQFSVAWTALTVLAVTVLSGLREFNNSKHRGKCPVAIIVLIIFFFIFGLIGCGASGSGALFGVFIGLYLLSQALLLRKKEPSLSLIEEDQLLNTPHPPDVQKRRDQARCDSYLCCCRNACMSCFSACANVKKICGWKHPDVAKREHELRKERRCLRTDLKLLFYFWLLFIVMQIIILQFGKKMNERITKTVAQNSNKTISGNSGPDEFCDLPYNPSGKGHLKLYDMALMGVLSYNAKADYNADFLTWFGNLPLQRVYPEQEIFEGPHDGMDRKLYFADFKDTSTNFSYVLLSSLNVAVPFMRSLDMWGEAIAFKIASLFAPTLRMWPEKNKASFIDGEAFFKNIIGGYKEADDLTDYIKKMKARPQGFQGVLIGHGWNGGYARMIGAKYGIPAIALNPPSTSIMFKKYGFDSPYEAKNPHVTGSRVYQTVRQLLSYIDDDVAAGDEVNYFPCPADKNFLECSSMKFLAKQILDYCGDRAGRTVG